MRGQLTMRRAIIGGVAAMVAGGVAFGTLAPAVATGPVGSSEHAVVDLEEEKAGGLTATQRRVIREATARYRDVEAAIADGYQPTDLCVEEPGLGGMGYHYAHPELVGHDAVDPTLPEILLYAPSPRGDLRLVAVEYLKNDADGDLGTDDDRPSLLGHEFKGPMEGHEPGQPVHYDIHAWVWKSNPAGELSDFNPNVRCSSDD